MAFKGKGVGVENGEPIYRTVTYLTTWTFGEAARNLFLEFGCPKEAPKGYNCNMHLKILMGIGLLVWFEIYEIRFTREVFSKSQNHKNTKSEDMKKFSRFSRPQTASRSKVKVKKTYPTVRRSGTKMPDRGIPNGLRQSDLEKASSGKIHVRKKPRNQLSVTTAYRSNRLMNDSFQGKERGDNRKRLSKEMSEIRSTAFSFKRPEHEDIQKSKTAYTKRKASNTACKGALSCKKNRRRRSTLYLDDILGFLTGNPGRNCTNDENSTLFCHGKLSCRNRCQNSHTVLYQTELSCYCDQDCDVFQDCCADYDDFCGENKQNFTRSNTTSTGPNQNEQNVTNSTTQNISTAENLVNQQNRDLWRCYEGKYFPGTRGIWMIGSCPSSGPDDDVSYRCRSLSQANSITIDNYRYLPVYSNNGRVYHNRFCAQCNGVSPKNLSGEFSLSISECDFTPPGHLSLDGKIKFLFQYFFDNIHWKASDGHPRRYCIDFESKKEYDPNVKTNSKYQAKCNRGKPRVVSTGYAIYKNADCAKLMQERRCIHCGPPTNYNTDVGILPKPLSLIFDFKPGGTAMKIKAQCHNDEVYDHYLQTCRNGMTSKGLPAYALHLNIYQVVLWVQLPEEISFLEEPIAYHFLKKVLKISHQKVIHFSVEHLDLLPIIKLQFTLEITQNERSQASIKRILDFTSPFNVSVFGQVFTIVKATNRILNCVNLQKYDRSEYTVLQDGSSAVSIKKTGEVLQSTDYYINTTEASANDSQAIFVCRQHQMSNCSGVYILMNEGEFRVLMNKSIFVNASKQVYDWSEYIWINKSVLVCENFSTTYYKTKVVPNDDPLLATITLVCMSLSIIGLFFVLVTYSLFSELRTPPGINLMNLSVSILLAQLLWLLGSGQTDTPTGCTVIAVILHYLFLVSFMWTSIIAFDTWRAFSAENRDFSASNRDKCLQVLRQMAVGWVPALAYVSICVVLDTTDTVNIGYKSRMACWMDNKWAILYFFAVPVFMCLVFNMMFFLMTFGAIKATTAQASAATDHNTKNNFGVYVRIASLMGFTWIFGFAAPFGWQFLWYPFVILNGLQGVFIALAFPLNKRARGLYKAACCAKPSRVGP